MSDDTTDIWDGDLLDYKSIGETFTNLIKSIDDSRVISIEAGFGRGKTFFRERWAYDLRAEGEVVIEIDALLSDHSGDPVVTFVGALAAALPKQDKTTAQKALVNVTKYGGKAGRALLKAGLREGAEELIDAGEGAILEQVEGWGAMEDAVKEMGDGLSKFAGKMIANQLAAEQVRQKELPEQFEALRKALTKDKENGRVVIIIDELDRCHPEYAIALLEAMKLVFNHDGFVFCLMINETYLENLAAHRFGRAGEGERYLDKFIDIRLKLPVLGVVFADAIRKIVLELPLKVPYGKDPSFGVDHAAKLASMMILKSPELSMRSVQRALLKVELALRVYGDRPLDCPLLVLLAFQGIDGFKLHFPQISRILPRIAVTPEACSNLRETNGIGELIGETREGAAFLAKNCKELLTLEMERFGLPSSTQSEWPDWVKIEHLAQHYIPEHQAMLDAVHRFDATQP